MSKLKKFEKKAKKVLTKEGEKWYIIKAPHARGHEKSLKKGEKKC